jgi:hypothetical protein
MSRAEEALLHGTMPPTQLQSVTVFFTYARGQGRTPERRSALSMARGASITRCTSYVPISVPGHDRAVGNEPIPIGTLWIAFIAGFEYPTTAQHHKPPPRRHGADAKAFSRAPGIQEEPFIPDHVLHDGANMNEPRVLGRHGRSDSHGQRGVDHVHDVIEKFID